MDRSRIETWVVTWLASRSLGMTVEEYAEWRGFDWHNRCDDCCGLHPERWEVKRDKKRGTWYECRECGRFIGYARR